MDSMFWSALPGLPRKVKWPIRVVEWDNKVQVYCRADNAYFKVSRDQLVPFPGPFDKLKSQGAAVLAQKKQVGNLTAFNQDVEWALECTKYTDSHDDDNECHEESDSTHGIFKNLRKRTQSSNREDNKDKDDKENSTESNIQSTPINWCNTKQQSSDKKDDKQSSKESYSVHGTSMNMRNTTQQSSNRYHKKRSKKSDSTHGISMNLRNTKQQSSDKEDDKESSKESNFTHGNCMNLRNTTQQSSDKEDDKQSSSESNSTQGTPMNRCNTKQQSSNNQDDKQSSTERNIQGAPMNRCNTTRQSSDKKDDKQSSTESISTHGSAMKLCNTTQQSSDKEDDKQSSKGSNSTQGISTKLCNTKQQSSDKEDDKQSSTESNSTQDISMKLCNTKQQSSDKEDDKESSKESNSTHGTTMKMCNTTQQSSDREADKEHSHESNSTHGTAMKMCNTTQQSLKREDNKERSKEINSTHGTSKNLRNTTQQSSDREDDKEHSNESNSTHGTSMNQCSATQQISNRDDDKIHSEGSTMTRGTSLDQHNAYAVQQNSYREGQKNPSEESFPKYGTSGGQSSTTEQSYDREDNKEGSEDSNPTDRTTHDHHIGKQESTNREDDKKHIGEGIATHGTSVDHKSSDESITIISDSVDSDLESCQFAMLKVKTSKSNHGKHLNLLSKTNKSTTLESSDKLDSNSGSNNASSKRKIAKLKVTSRPVKKMKTVNDKDKLIKSKLESDKASKKRKHLLVKTSKGSHCKQVGVMNQKKSCTNDTQIYKDSSDDLETDTSSDSDSSSSDGTDEPGELLVSDSEKCISSNNDSSKRKYSKLKEKSRPVKKMKKVNDNAKLKASEKQELFVAEITKGSHCKQVGVMNEKKTCTSDTQSYTTNSNDDSESELSSDSVSFSSDGTDEEEHLVFDSEKCKKVESEVKRVKRKLRLRDTNNSHIFVRKLRTSKYHALTGIRKKSKFVWNQVHSCKFCKIICTNIAKHYTSRHKDTIEVVEIMKLTKQKGPKDKMVRAKWDMLRQEGDHYNNMKVLTDGKGEFILSRRQHDKLDISRYGPCPSCFAWLRMDKTMFKHRKTCPAVILENDTDENVSARELRIRSLGLAGKLNPQATQVLKDEVFTIMTKDNISSIAQEDPLIVALGNLWMSKNIGNQLKRKYYTSSRMRGAARLLLNARQITGHDDYSVHDFLVTEHFNDIVKAALMTASPEIDDTEDLKSPSAAIKIGYDIKRMLGAKWAQSLKEKSPNDKKEAKDFFKLMEIEWSSRVTKLASIILQVRKFNMEKSLPEPSDIVDLSKHIKEEIKLLDLTDMSPATFQRACQLAEALLLLYNKRRSGEVEGIRIVDYVKRQSGMSNIDNAMRAGLSALEKKLIESQDLLETRGKFGRGVPVIIPPVLKDVLQYLATASIRTKAARLPSNKYLFANTNKGVLRAYDSLKIACSEINLIKPEKITSVNLRKYTATISQVFDLNEQQQSWLVNHLGHSTDIHKIHYRQTSGAIERIDISKLMLIQEFNLASKYAGKKLCDIQLKELLFESNKDGPDMSDQEDLPDEVNLQEDVEYQPGEADVEDRVFDEFDFTEEDEVQVQPRKKSGTDGNRQRWSPIEMAELKKYFKENLDTLTTPGQKSCLKAIQASRNENGLLCRRSWETIKKKVWNEIQKKK